MLKKLQNLLFEEEETEEIEEEVEEIPEPAPKRRREAAAEPVKPEPKQEEPRTSMQRIDVTQPLQKITDALPQNQGSVFKPAENTYTQLDAEKPKGGLGLTIDEVEGSAQKPQPEPAKKPAPAQQQSRTSARQKKPSYDFSPVISPFFGVDDKDPNVVHTTGSSGRGNKADEGSPVISPINGIIKNSKDEEPAPAFRPASRPSRPEVKKPEPEPEEKDDVAEFSLDDILKVRDEEYARDNRSVMQSLFPDLDGTDETEIPDETTVLDSRNITPYGMLGRKQ